MALLNEILGVAARFSDGLWRKFNIVGGAPSPQLTPEITPVVVMPGDVSDRYIQHEALFSRYVVIGNDATHVAQIQLRNPANSGLLCVIEKISAQRYSESTPLVFFGFFVGVSSIDYASTVNAQPLCRDSRQGIPGSALQQLRKSPMVISWQNSVSLPATFDPFNWGGYTPNYQPCEERVGWVISPGYALIGLSFTANAAVTFGFSWIERPHTALELAL